MKTANGGTPLRGGMVSSEILLGHTYLIAQGYTVFSSVVHLILYLLLWSTVQKAQLWDILNIYSFTLGCNYYIYIYTYNCDITVVWVPFG